MKYCFIINPAAGKGKIATELSEKIRALCESRSLDFEIYRTTGIGDATEYVKRTCAADPEQTYRFYACGGDGTLGEAASGIMALSDSSRVSLGLFPMGTGNDFARLFSPKELLMDPEAQLDATTVAIDVLRCNDRHAINVVNVGFDCEVVVKTAGLKRNPLIPSNLAYIAGLVGTLVKKPCVDMTISTDGGEEEQRHLLLSTFANGSFYGGGFHSNPLSSLDDGMIDLVRVEEVTRRKFLTLVGDYKKGTHIQPKFDKIVKHAKAERVDIRFPRTTNVSFDGEVVPCDELHVEVLKKALTFLVPKGAQLRMSDK